MRIFKVILSHKNTVFIQIFFLQKILQQLVTVVFSKLFTAFLCLNHFFLIKNVLAKFQVLKLNSKPKY